ncbi:MAG: DUF1614 domain-containing protein [Methanomicrobiales archaeon]|nr:DUF1614 domain-containing protein [Methanomicrobiales archaeon]
MDRYVFNPFTLLALALFFVLTVLIVPLLILGLIGGALTNLGFSWGQALTLLVLTLLGSFINIPVTTIENRRTIIRREYTMFGMLYRIPEVSIRTIIAVNVGGAVIPVVISLYLLAVAAGRTGAVFLGAAAAGVLLVALVTNRVARPVPGLGIATPVLIPPLAALVAGIVLAGIDPASSAIARPVIAYTSGTLGTLIGADLLNLRRIGELGAPVASIGGAGTFDGIFLSGIIAAFLA